MMNSTNMSMQKNRNGGGQENEYGFIPPHNGSRYGYDADEASWVAVMKGFTQQEHNRNAKRCWTSSFDLI